MLRVNPKTGQLTERSLKQREMIFAYSQDEALKSWPILRRLMCPTPLKKLETVRPEAIEPVKIPETPRNSPI